MLLQKILKEDNNYHLTQFDNAKIDELEQKIIWNDKGIPYIKCLVRNKEVKLTPEEIIRQLYIEKLINEYGYDSELFKVESEVQMGSSGKRADIVIYEKERPTQPYIIVELKSPENPTAKDGKKQLESYCKFSGAAIGVWTDGNVFSQKKQNSNLIKHI